MANSIDLRGAIHPQLTFRHKYDFVSYGYDDNEGRVYISTNKGRPGTWILLKQFFEQSGGWIYTQIDLSGYSSYSNARIMFLIYDDKYYTDNHSSDGWTIDDVRIGEDTDIPTFITITSGNGQVGETGLPLNQPLVATVYDSDSNPIEGIPVTFEITAGGGSLSVTTTTSGANGRVSTELTLGSSPGSNTAAVTIDGSSPVQQVEFSATGFNPGQPVALSKLSGDNQTGEVNTQLAPFEALVTDVLGNPVAAGVNVTFSITAGGGSLAFTGAVQTDGFGIARNTLTLGAIAGQTAVIVSSQGLSPVSFTAHAFLAGGDADDYDADQIPNGWEAGKGFDPLDPSDAGEDADNDSLSNREEYTRGTDPRVDDSDSDGMKDGWEVQYGLDPLYAGDADDDNDNDGFTNLQEHNGQGDGVPVFARHFQIAGPTSESMDFYGLLSIDGVPAEVGDEVAAICPENVICGRYSVDTPGQYGFMHVYGDDPLTTGVDEGAVSGDELTFKVWDRSKNKEFTGVAASVVTGTAPPSWTTANDFAHVDLGAGAQIIPLHAGWNLISFSAKTCFYADGVLGHEDGQPDEPMLPGTVFQKVTGIADVFTSINGLYDVVRSFDSKGLHTFDPASPGESNLKYVAGGYGYWIKMNTAGNLEINGVRALASDTLNLRSGWNLVGYWHADIQYTGAEPLDVQFPSHATQKTAVANIGDVVSAISENCLVIRSYDIHGAHTYDPLLGGFNDLEYLGPGYGMWIKMSAEDVLSY